ncbi:molybdenum cofactor guanylyltransferase MobA [Thalassobaculum sp. OXR-137]|uniref:molybdenum cofactor guanylyltransferase MobA n=1 Tax=Thalassobaculum sp. OXR-137 TaxID=3100173 RepID=UPI002AC8EC24|nr:molybdenum cofactor guanylyltransferase MobA [Thalassobaculum sp. OXR-137]WPZ32599.1 molybdenum cofactor guanylyltransferase MobA [Thalassobaculum sp. OXR-137]
MTDAMDARPTPPPASGDAVLGVILAGGLARRMGGGDKGLVALDGRTLLQRVIDRLEGQVGGLVLNANGDPARFAAYGLPVVGDTVADHPGPLAGILAGLEHAAAGGWDWIATVPVDTPCLPGDLVDRLRVALADEAAEIACAASGGRVHPVVGLWPVTLIGPLRAALAEGTRKVEAFAGARRRAVAEWPAAPHDPFVNVNAPEDLQRIADRDK